MSETTVKHTAELAETVAEKLDADVILYNGGIGREQDRFLIDALIDRELRTNVLLLLVTNGGDPDAAYRMARALQAKYERFILYVSGFCKSAGTLVATGAHELIMSDHGELGPLDVQMSKKDELWETQSGLTPMETLNALQNKALTAFEDFFLSIKARSGGAITLRTATQIATELTTGLFAPLYSQVDPLHVGEAGRAMSIASRYGKRLLVYGCNIDQEALKFLTTQYPSHGFVIDRQEASRLFEEVREPTAAEVELAQVLGDRARRPMPLATEHPFEFLSQAPSPIEQESTDFTTEGNSDGQVSTSAGTDTPTATSKSPELSPRGNGKESAGAEVEVS